MHSLRCVKSEALLLQHSGINSVIIRSLSSAKISFSVEPHSLCRLDGKCPDGVTISSWKSGRSLVWDVNCADTYAAFNIPQSTRKARAIAMEEEEMMKVKYQDIAKAHYFVPVVIETSGAFGPAALELLTDISRKVRKVTHSQGYLFQQVSVALQRGNAAAILGTFPVDTSSS